MIPRIFTKFLQNKLLLAKVIFSVYNLSTITILSIYFDKELSGKMLYTQGIILLAAAFSRLGSDYYWVSSSRDALKIEQKELSFIMIGSLIATFLFYLAVNDKNTYTFFLMFSSVLSMNFIQFLGRIYQKKEKHVLSLFLLSIAPSVLVIPILFLSNDINLFAIVFISSFSIIVIIISIYGLPIIEFETRNSSYRDRLNFFPVILYGTINQNIISILGGITGKEEQTVLLVLFQRISGLVLWPQLFHMQQNLRKMNQSLTNVPTFISNLKTYIYGSLKQTIIYSIVVTVICFYLLFKSNRFDLFTSQSFIIILFASIINNFFGHIQYQMGKSKNGLPIIFILALSVSIALLHASVNHYDFIALSYSFLLFHCVVHIFSYYILINWIRKA